MSMFVIERILLCDVLVRRYVYVLLLDTKCFANILAVIRLGAVQRGIHLAAYNAPSSRAGS